MVCFRDKRTYFSNVNIICKKLNRPTNHLKMFIEKEFCCKTNFVGHDTICGVLILKGKFNQLHLQKLIKNHINFFVVCKNCNNFNTVMENLWTAPRREIRKMNLLKCLDCKAINFVSSL